QHIAAVHREVVDGRDEDVEVAVAVDVGHGNASLPAYRVGHTGAIGDVLESVVALVDVEPIRANVRGEVKVGQAIVVDVAGRNSAAVVVVQVVQNVERGVFWQPIDERDARATRGKELEKRSTAGCGVAANEQNAREPKKKSLRPDVDYRHCRDDCRDVLDTRGAPFPQEDSNGVALTAIPAATRSSERFRRRLRPRRSASSKVRWTD